MRCQIQVARSMANQNAVKLESLRKLPILAKSMGTSEMSYSRADANELVRCSA